MARQGPQLHSVLHHERQRREHTAPHLPHRQSTHHSNVGRREAMAKRHSCGGDVGGARLLVVHEVIVQAWHDGGAVPHLPHALVRLHGRLQGMPHLHQRQAVLLPHPHHGLRGGVEAGGLSQ
jgi:hypothetical protein